MVNLPTYVPQPVGYNHRGHQINRLVDKYNHGPTTLIQLEEYAESARAFMGNLSNNPNIRQIAINRIRQFYNLEFKLFCDVCGTAHYQDEITAPER